LTESFDVVVIGGGTAGLVTASGCARLGRKVALIERDALGGDCLWTGCVPTKALVASARLAHQMRNARAWGLEPVAPRLNPKSIMDSMREQQRIISRHDDPAKFRALGIDVINGSARLVSPSEVEIDSHDSGEPTTRVRRLRARDIVIATGARTAVPPIEGLEESGYLDHVSFLKQDEFPSSLIILGGGYIGLEFAQIFARFGSKVTVVEMEEEILGKEDRDLVERLRLSLTAEGIEIFSGWKLSEVRKQGETTRIATITNRRGSSRQLTADSIFVASGRRGNTEGLGLENIGVAVERSWIVADKFLQTSIPRIWACGDVHGGLQFTHVAAYEAVKLVRNMLFPGKSPVDYSNVPWTLYTDPELAHIGMTEAEARIAEDDEVKVYQIEVADIDRAVVDRGTAGIIKLVCDKRGRILGGHALCSNASTVIQEIVLARHKGMKVSDLARRISSYPSLSDGVQKAAALYYQELAEEWLGRLGRRVARWSQ
jgi:pyruvate/2-oxoglutarate dehydrogenase complex dihydrolipoamide dehydrogenase (E3) component